MSTLIDRDNELKFLKNMTDDQAYANALSDPDNPPLTEEQLATVVRLRDVPGETLLEKFRNAQHRESKQTITARFDADVVRKGVSVHHECGSTCLHGSGTGGDEALIPGSVEPAKRFMLEYMGQGRGVFSAPAPRKTL